MTSTILYRGAPSCSITRVPRKAHHHPHSPQPSDFHNPPTRCATSPGWQWLWTSSAGWTCLGRAQHAGCTFQVDGGAKDLFLIFKELVNLRCQLKSLIPLGVPTAFPLPLFVSGGKVPTLECCFCTCRFFTNLLFENPTLIWMRTTISFAGNCCECDSHKGGVGNNACRPLWPGGRQVPKVFSILGSSVHAVVVVLLPFHFIVVNDSSYLVAAVVL